MLLRDASYEYLQDMCSWKKGKYQSYCLISALYGAVSVLFQLVPEMAKVKSWHSMEINGWIYIWYHAEEIEPKWLPPEIEEISNGKWQYGGRTEHYINSHIEVPYLY